MSLPEAIAQALERRVSADEVREALQRPLDEIEREDVLSLVQWFTRRYQSPEEKLAYVKRAYRRWKRATAAHLPDSY